MEADGESQYNQISQSNTIQSSNPLSYRDVVQVINGNFKGYYAIVTETGDLSNLEREDEIEINYLKKSFGKWIVVPHDLDSRTISDRSKMCECQSRWKIMIHQTLTFQLIILSLKPLIR